MDDRLIAALRAIASGHYTAEGCAERAAEALTGYDAPLKLGQRVRLKWGWESIFQSGDIATLCQPRDIFLTGEEESPEDMHGDYWAVFANGDRWCIGKLHQHFDLFEEA